MKHETLPLVSNPVSMNVEYFHSPTHAADKGLSISRRYRIHGSLANVFSAKFSPDSSVFASTYGDGTVHIHDAKTGDLLIGLQDNFRLT